VEGGTKNLGLFIAGKKQKWGGGRPLRNQTAMKCLFIEAFRGRFHDRVERCTAFCFRQPKKHVRRRVSKCTTRFKKGDQRRRYGVIRKRVGREEDCCQWTNEGLEGTSFPSASPKTPSLILETSPRG